jgi:hypothetical protein
MNKLCYPANHPINMRRDPVYAYLESNPYNVMYPTAMVPYVQSVANPFPTPTPFYKKYDNYNCLNGNGFNTPGEICVNITFPNTFTDGTTTHYNIVTGTSSVTLNKCDAISSSGQATLESGPYKILLNGITLNYTYGINNNLATWGIYGGKINFRDNLSFST